MAKLDPGYLFNLVKSMTKAEKRHFKVYSSKRVLGNENIYFNLFDEIEAQASYDEEKIRQQPEFKDLPTLKKRLYKALLVSLAEFHSSTGIEVRAMIDYIEILFNKSLLNHCMRQIRKAKKIIQQHELFEEWLQVLKWEYKVSVKRSEMRTNILQEEKKVFSLLSNQKKYRDAANLFLMKYERFGAERSPRDMRGMKNIISSSLLRDEKRALSFVARQNFLDCHSLFSIIKGDYARSYHFGKKTMDLYLANPAMVNSFPSSYLTRINNFLLTCLETAKYEEMLPYIDRMQEVRKNLNSPYERATAFSYLYHLLNYYLYTGLFDRAREDLNRMEEELPEHEMYMSPLQKITLFVIIAQVYFGLQDYKRSLSWLNRIWKINLRTGLENFIRLFYLVVHYETGSDKELMGSILRSTHRFLVKNKRLFKFESAVLDFFRQYVTGGSQKKNMIPLFVNLKKKVMRLSKDPYEKQALAYFDYISWIESNIESRPFAEIVRRKQKS